MTATRLLQRGLLLKAVLHMRGFESLAAPDLIILKVTATGWGTSWRYSPTFLQAPSFQRKAHRGGCNILHGCLHTCASLHNGSAPLEIVAWTDVDLLLAVQNSKTLPPIVGDISSDNGEYLQQVLRHMLRRSTLKKILEII